MQRILRVGDDVGVCRGSLRILSASFPMKASEVPPWACVCSLHVPAVPRHSTVQPCPAVGPRLVCGALAGSQGGFHKSIQEQRE